MTDKIITMDHIIFNSYVSTKEECLRIISNLAKDIGISSNSQETFEGLVERENIVSTGLNDGFAIPHTRSDSIKQPAIIVVKMKEGIEWETMDDEAVTVAIALLVPIKMGGNFHVKLLSTLSRRLVKKEFRKSLKSSNDKKELFDLLSEVFKEED